MKRITFLLFFTSLFSISFGQSWVWGGQGNIGTNGIGEGYSLTTDINKNAFLTGHFLDTLLFKSNTIVSDTNWGAFLIKYDSSGNIKWARCSQWGLGGNGCISNSVASDKNGNSYITGIYEKTVIFYPDTLTDPPNNTIYFLTKYDKNGNVLWAKRANGSSASISWAVATSNDSHEYITGDFAGTLICGHNTLSTSGGAIFLAKYDSTGKAIWGRQSSVSPSSATAYAVATDPKNNVFITGYFSDSLVFGSIVLTTAPSIPFYSFFLTKYDSSGKILWATDGSLKNRNSILVSNSVCTDKAGNSYITGYFADTISIGAYTLVSNNASDFFIAAFDPSGNVLWAKAPVVLDNNSWQGYSLADDTMGHLYLSAGGYNNFEPFQGIAFGTDTFKLYNSTDATVLLKFDLLGNLLCGSIIPSGGDDNNGIATDPNGSYVYLGGDFWDLTYVFGKDTLSGSKGEYPFVVKWSATCNNSNNESVTDVNNSNSSVTLFPNPNNSQFTISLQGVSRKTEVEIFNMLGEKVYEETLRQAQGDNTIDLPCKSAGVYLYRILTETGDLISNGKFVIQ